MEDFAMSALERKKQGIAEHSMERQYIFVTPSFFAFHLPFLILA
jgi:hypothetical protein